MPPNGRFSGGNCWQEPHPGVFFPGSAAGAEALNYRTKMNVRKMGENRIIEQQRSDKNYRTTKKIRRKIRYIFFHTFRGKQNYRTTGYGK